MNDKQFNEDITNKLTNEQAKKLNRLKNDYMFSNQNIRNANYNKGKNKALLTAFSSCNEQQFIEKLAEPTPIKKSKRRQAQEFLLVKTNKPVSTYKGLNNPVKLNLSQDTLEKLKQFAKK